MFVAPRDNKKSNLVQHPAEQLQPRYGPSAPSRQSHIKRHQRHPPPAHSDPKHGQIQIQIYGSTRKHHKLQVLQRLTTSPSRSSATHASLALVISASVRIESRLRPRRSKPPWLR